MAIVGEEESEHGPVPASGEPELDEDDGRANDALAAAVGDGEEEEEAAPRSDDKDVTDSVSAIDRVAPGEHDSLEDGQTKGVVRSTAPEDEAGPRCDDEAVLDSRPALGDAVVQDIIVTMPVMIGEHKDTSDGVAGGALDASAQHVTSGGSRNAQDVDNDFVANLRPTLSDGDVATVAVITGEEEDAGTRGKPEFMKAPPLFLRVVSDERESIRHELVNDSAGEREEEGWDGVADGSRNGEPAGSNGCSAVKNADDGEHDIIATIPVVTRDKEDIGDHCVEAAGARGRAEFIRTVPDLVRVVGEEEDSFDEGQTKKPVPGAVEERSDEEVVGDGDIQDIIAAMPAMVGEEDDEAAGAPGKVESAGRDDEDTGDGVADRASDGSARDVTCGGSESGTAASSVDDEVVSDLPLALGVGEEEDLGDMPGSPLAMSVPGCGEMACAGPAACRTRCRADDGPLGGPSQDVIIGAARRRGEEEDFPLRPRTDTGRSKLSTTPSLVAEDGKITLGHASYPSGFLTQSFLSQRMTINMASVTAVASDFLPDSERPAGLEAESFLLGTFQSADELLGKSLDVVLGIDQ
jgi:hypothetical protein